MQIEKRRRIVVPLVLAMAFAVPAAAQQPPATTPAAPASSAPAKKPAPKPKPAAASPAAAKPATTSATTPATPPAIGGVKPTLLGQYADWGAYTASPAGKKTCFAIAKPASSVTSPPNRPRNPIYMFISTRPAEKVTNEVSLIIGYPFKPGTEASVEVGSTAYALYTQQDGAWIKNATEEAQMVDAMRQGQTAAVKGASAKGTQSTDTFSLKGLSQALDRTAQDCK
jgi:Invasion associated locus B (IalB) protein